ncbi:uncharacterized protein TRAVEDRAFT_47600 [Trametes versicolor FP-101664 SS1]|uniref:uncharacterized protein n=1 Tax=Trametes versicolor (strain FP-101664) TaxID=717944 RepID=UPI0004623F80|nr:uncharacterized protein TRAVEDRAFT_47600 [Trametes versicolor FP-101664 SS1]EIW58444.1 hypothetical protein TRAVEDRAFT_47600 [Trametes versicolor FP-101664 SS1]
MGEHAVRGGAPTFASFGANANDTNRDYRHTDPYHADQPASDGIAEEYNQRTLTTAHQVFVRPQIGFHDHSQVVSEPAAIQADASYNIGLLGGDFVGPPASTSAENDVSYSPSFLNNEFYQPVDEGEIALLIQNILQQVEDVLGGKDANTSASQHPTSYPQHSLSAPAIHPHSALSPSLDPPPAHFWGESGPLQFPFPFPTPSTASFDVLPDVAYDQHQYAPLDAQGSPSQHVAPANDRTTNIMPLLAKMSHYPEMTVSRLGPWGTHSDVVMEHPDASHLGYTSTASTHSSESDFCGALTDEPGSSPTESQPSYILSPGSNERAASYDNRTPASTAHL